MLFSNACKYDCAYCVNRRSNDIPRATFTPKELINLTLEFYRRNYIEGLFLSSGVLQTPDYTTELMIRAIRILRDERGFRGYIHAKAVPGTSPELITELGNLVDRLSINLELPSCESLSMLAPQKSRKAILGPMRHIADGIAEQKEYLALARRKGVFYPGKIQKAGARAGGGLGSRTFAPAGQSTQMIIGASPETDYQILGLSAALYRTLGLKRVFFSAYVPLNDDTRLPSGSAIPLDREHRLYQADWLMRFYKFDAAEIIDEKNPFLDLSLDPKANWAVNNLDLFPVEVNTAPYEVLLRVPGIGVVGAQSIMKARRTATLREPQLKKLGIALKRARYFITCDGRYAASGIPFTKESVRAQLVAPIDGGSHGRRSGHVLPGQLSLFDANMQPSGDGSAKRISQPRKEEAAQMRSSSTLGWPALPGAVAHRGVSTNANLALGWSLQ